MVMIRLLVASALAAHLSAAPCPAATRRVETVGLRVAVPVVVDGILDERPWGRAPEAGALIAVPSDRRDPSQVRTSLKILYDETALYLGFACRDDRPDAVYSRATARDADIRGEDSVFVLLEASGDEDRLYFFATNVLGAALDGRIGKNGENFDVRWDGRWRNACRTTDWGWTAELAIDLAGLGYAPKKDWSLPLSLARVVPRLDRSFWSEPLDPAFRVSEISRLPALALPQSELRADLSPFALTSLEEGGSGGLRAGIEGGRVFSRNLEGRAALNPDFLTAPADVERVNLTRYELYLPERRPFFAGLGDGEDGGALSLFYTKRIGDIWGGAWADVRAGEWTITALSAYAKGDSGPGLDPALYAMARLGRSWGDAGSVGFTAAHRFADGSGAGTAGLSGTIRLHSTWSLAGQAALSYGPNGPASVALWARPSYDTETFHFHLAYRRIGERFGDNANAVAFIPDDNRSELQTGLVQRIPIRNAFFSSLSLDAGGAVAWGSDGTLRSWDAAAGTVLALVRKFDIGVHHLRDYKLFERDFRNRMTRIDIDYNRTERWQAVGLSVTFGRNFEADFDMFELRKRFLFTRELSFEYDLQRVKVRRRAAVEEVAARQTFIHVVRLVNRFSRTMTMDVFFQSHSAIKKAAVQAYFIIGLGEKAGSLTAGVLGGNAPFGVKGTQGATFVLKYAPSL
ncbi:MAG: hypothetical protein JW742_09550 [Candidatus Aminicenantes bacterium]|nr:hypothetical protein [Candidatus Aminicenantes bacterium]